MQLSGRAFLALSSKTTQAKGNITMLYKTNVERQTVYAPNGLHEVAQFLQDTPGLWEYSSSTRKSRGHEWDLGAEYQGAWKIAKDGWHDGAAKLASNLGAIALPANGKRRKRKLGVSGSSVSVSRYLQGMPKHMRARGRVSGNERVISIAVNMCASAFTKARQFEAFGLAMASLVVWMERTGVRVELDVIFKTKLSSKRKGWENSCAIAGWKVKRANDALDESAIAFALGHPAAFRRIGFALIERSDPVRQSFGYGKVCTPDAADIEALGLAPETIVIDGLGAKYKTIKSSAMAIAYAAQQVNEAYGSDVIDPDTIREGVR